MIERRSSSTAASEASGRRRRTTPGATIDGYCDAGEQSRDSCTMPCTPSPQASADSAEGSRWVAVPGIARRAGHASSNTSRRRRMADEAAPAVRRRGRSPPQFTSSDAGSTGECRQTTRRVSVDLVGERLHAVHAHRGAPAPPPAERAQQARRAITETGSQWALSAEDVTIDLHPSPSSQSEPWRVRGCRAPAPGARRAF